MWISVLFGLCAKSLSKSSSRANGEESAYSTIFQYSMDGNHASPACCSCCSMLSDVFELLNISSFLRFFVLFCLFWFGRESLIGYLGQNLKSLLLFVRKWMNFEECTSIDVFNTEFLWNRSSWKGSFENQGALSHWFSNLWMGF